MLCDFERGFIVGTRMAGASFTQTAQLASVSLGTVTEETSAIRSMGKTSVNTFGNCARLYTFDDRDSCALVRYVGKNRRATLLQVTGNVNAGRDVSKSSPSTITQRGIL